MSETFQIVHVPDGQKQSAATWLSMAQWIVDHITSNNIKLVTCVGDLIENADSLSAVAEYAAVTPAVALIRASGVAMGILPGNHDLRQSSVFVSTFPQSAVSGFSWYVSATSDQCSYAQRFTAGGIEFINLSIKFGPTSGGATLAWAAGVIAANPTARVILSTHSYLEVSGTLTAEGTIIYSDLITPYASQIFLVLCGHRHGTYHRVDTISGYQIDSLLADYQDESATNGGDGYMRLITLSV